MLPTAPSADRSKELSPLLPLRIPFFWPTATFRRLVVRYGMAPHESQRTGIPIRATPRKSAAQFVGGAWTPAASVATQYDSPMRSPWVTTAIDLSSGDSSARASRKARHL